MPLVVALAVAAVILMGSGAGRDERGGAADDPAGQEQQRPVAEETPGTPEVDGELRSPALGDEDAPVVMVEYSDYQ